jgi:hypothetical protein
MSWIAYPPGGRATLTHYSLPTDYVAACGCTPASTHYPTAALSQMAFGSSTAYGQCPLSPPGSSHLALRPGMRPVLHANSPESGDSEPPLPPRPQIHHRQNHRFVPTYSGRLVRRYRRKAKLVRPVRAASLPASSQRPLVRAHTLISIWLTPLTLSPMTFSHQTNLYTATRFLDSL